MENGPVEMIPLVTRKLLSEMSIGDSRVFIENRSVKNSGAAVTSYAHRAKIKVKTETCFIVIPTTLLTIKAVIVQRLQ